MLDYQSLKTNIFNLVNVDAQKVLDSIEDEEYCDPVNPRKRKRLDDFTPQERLIRRKLKNRAAAQHARDRKKEKMDHLEKVVSQLEIENKELKRSNEELQTNMNILMSQNRELLLYLGKPCPSEENKKSNEPTVVDMGTDHTYSTKQLELSDSKEVLHEDHVVIKKEKETVTKQAAEITDSSCFLDHDVVIQSQIGQLLDFSEQVGSRDCIEENDSSESESKVEEGVIDDSQSYRNCHTEKYASHVGRIFQDEADELFELCEEVQDLVRETESNIMTDPVNNKSSILELDLSNVVNDANHDVRSLNVSIDFSECNNSSINNNLKRKSVKESIFDIQKDIINDLPNEFLTSSCIDVLDDRSLFEKFTNDLSYIENNVSSSNDSTSSTSMQDSYIADDWDDLMSDLFPSLTSL